jgi:hypothetical protein
MNELRRAEDLDAMGVVSYVSRQQLPGAAVARRLEVVPTQPAQTDTVSGVVAGEIIGRNRPTDPVAPKAEPQVQPGSEPVPRFSLAAIVAGRWLWLEELAGMPLTSEQVRLVQSMARALLITQAQGQEAVAGTIPDLPKPDVEQFHWPIHTNHQLDLDATAARAGVAAFVSRRLEKHDCRGLVLLGRACATWVPAQELNVPTVFTVSSAEMLISPSHKQAVWQDLRPFANGT